MWPFGHIALAYIVYASLSRTYFSRSPSRGVTLILAVSSLFPDLIDKPLAWYLHVLPTGRSLAHSLVVLVPISAIVVLLARRNGRGEYGLAFATGAVSHAVIDAVPVLWDPANCADFLLWPLFSRGGCTDATSMAFLTPFARSLWPAYLLAEFVLVGVALVLWHTD